MKDITAEIGRVVAPWRLPILAVAGALALLLTVGAVDAWTERSAADFLRDSNAVTVTVWWVGGGSMVNVSLWAVAAALAAFVASLHRPVRGVMVVFAALSVLLWADDMLLLHETAEQRLGIPELLFFSPYAVTALALAWLLRPGVAGAPGALLVVAGAFLAGSIALDVVVASTGTAAILMEDGAKLVGTALWACVPVMLHQEMVRRQQALDQGSPVRTGEPAGTVRPGSVVDEDVRPART